MNVSFEEVKKVVVDVLKIDGANITPETEFIKDLKADSMDQFFLIDGFSEAFNAMASIRRALATPTIFNVLGPLLNSAHLTYQLMDVADPTILDMIEIGRAHV